MLWRMNSDLFKELSSHFCMLVFIYLGQSGFCRFPVMFWMLLFWIQHVPCGLSMPSHYYQYSSEKASVQHSTHRTGEMILVLLKVQGKRGIDPRMALPGMSVCSWEHSRWLQLELCWGGKRFANSLLWSEKHSFKTFLHFSHSSIPADLSQTFKILLDASVYLLHLHEFYIILHVQTQGIKNTVLFLFPSSSVKEIKRLWYIWLSSPFGFFSEVIAVLK